MANLPVIVGMGGVNPAGRGSSHHAYRRLVIDNLSPDIARQTWASLASLSNQLSADNGNWMDGAGQRVDYASYLDQLRPQLEQSTLIRKLEQNLFDPDHLLFHRRATLSQHNQEALRFSLRKKQLPEQIPPGWEISEDPEHHNRVNVSCSDSFEVLLQNYRNSPVNSAGQLPSGFDPAALYPSRNHPRGLQLAIYAASDAVNSLGIDWETVSARVAPDQISVYAGSGLSQMDYNGNGGMMQARLLGKKVTSKQLPLGYAEMPADFINAYVLGNLGTTGTNVAACATFLYNLRQGIKDIQSGSHRVVIVGTSEAPLIPEIIDGFATMGALADDASLRELDGIDQSASLNHRRACRPFGDNVGFTLAESAQCLVLFDDELALELGANIYGAINEVFINADGFKKSIASPGLGNYLSMAKAAAATANIIGEDGLRQRSFVQAHGTGTPQNRRTESHILSKIAQNFGIERWPVTAVKSYLGHSLASSAGDQILCSLGVWEHGLIPGIRSISGIADDVHTDNLDFLLQHKQVDNTGMDAVIINSKGFGGNNSSASILAPHIAERMLGKKHGAAAMSKYQKSREQVREQASAYDKSANAGKNNIIYKFDHNVLDGDALEISQDSLKISGHQQIVNLKVKNSYSDMCD